jgi:FkbM family methyltransferase
MEFVRRDKYKNYQHLVIVDFDDVNATDIDANEFESALRFLESAPEVHGVFTNSLPVYYDIWALRHQEWCPTDCWAEQRECQDLPKDQATERYVYSRQLFIPSDTPPIPVQSAFGGLAIYRLSSALKGIYNGISKDGSEVCEHVSFNIDISKGGKLYIYPKLHNYAPLEHLSPSMLSLGDSRELMLEQNGRECRLIAPDKHLLDKYRQNHPLYDRRLPLLTQLMSQATPDKCMIDVGANIGDTIALCRLGGCELDIVAVEPSQQYFSYLELNRRSLPELFNRVHPVRAFIGTPGDHMILVEDRGTASVKVICDDSAHNDVSPAVQTQSFDMVTKMPVSIIKTDTDGYDASIIASNIQFIRDQLPVLWVETDTTGSENENQWRQILSDLSPTHPFVCIFDNFGFLVAYGKLSEKQETIINLIGYARRHKANRKDEVGEPRIYYLDLALFPDQYINVYNEFVAALQESH